MTVKPDDTPRQDDERPLVPSGDSDVTRDTSPLGLPRLAHSLSAKLLVFTILFVMLAEVLIYVPSIASYRETYLKDKIAVAHLASLSIDATPDGMVTEELEVQLLEHVGATQLYLYRNGGMTNHLQTMDPGPPDVEFDMTERSVVGLIVDAFDALAQTEPRLVKATGNSPHDPAVKVSVVFDEGPMRAEMIDYSNRILALSIIISLITAALVFLALMWLFVRPMRRITHGILQFRDDPQDQRQTIAPSGRGDELGSAETALAEMQHTVREALRQQARLAALGTAVAKINHDLRNMLSSAVLVSERLTSSDDPEVRRVASRLVNALDRAGTLCQQTLDYARQGTIDLVFDRVSLNAILDEVAEAASDRARDEIHLSLEVPRPCQLQADRAQLFRALFNLVANAVDAGSSEIRITARTTTDSLSLLIADNGPGLPPRAREHLFEPFSGGARAGGTGLGLAIARELVRAHGGDVRLIDSTAQGTTFMVELPRGNDNHGGT